MSIAIIGGGGGGGGFGPGGVQITDVDGLQALLDGKADDPEVAQIKQQLDGKAAAAHDHDERYYTKVQTPSVVDQRIELQKGAANGLAALGANGKLLPGLVDTLYLTQPKVVASEAEMLAGVKELGDVAVRSDLRRSFIHNGGTSGTMADFYEMLSPGGDVLSVNGKTAVVVLTTSDIAEGTNRYFTEERTAAVVSGLKAKAGELATLDSDGKLAEGQRPEVFPAGGVTGQVLGLNAAGQRAWLAGSRYVIDIPILTAADRFQFFALPLGLTEARLVALDRNTGIPVTLTKEVTVTARDARNSAMRLQLKTDRMAIVRQALALQVAEGDTLRISNDNSVTDYSQGLKTGTINSLLATGQGNVIAAVWQSAIRRSTDGALSFGPAVPNHLTTYHYRLRRLAGMNYLCSLAGLQTLDETGAWNSIRYRGPHLTGGFTVRTDFLSHVGRSFLRIQNTLYTFEDEQARIVPVTLPGAGAVLWMESFGGQLYLSRGTGGIWRSTDGLTGWTQIVTGLPTGYNMGAMAIAFGKLYAASTSQGIFEWDAPANTWRNVSDGLTNLLFTRMWGISDALYAATDGLGVWQFNPTNRRWSAINEGLLHNTVRDLYAFGGWLYAITGAGVYRRSLMGGSWAAFGAGLATNLIFNSFASDGQSLIVCTSAPGGTPSGFFRLNESGTWVRDNFGAEQGSLAVNSTAWGIGQLPSGLWTVLSGQLLRRVAPTEGWRIHPNGITDLAELEGSLYPVGGGLLLRFEATGKELIVAAHPHQLTQTATSSMSWAAPYNGRLYLVGSSFGLRSIDPAAPGLDARLHGSLGNFTASAVHQQNALIWFSNGAGSVWRLDCDRQEVTQHSAGLPAGKQVRAIYSVGETVFCGIENAGCFRWSALDAKWEPVNNGLSNLEVNTFSHDERFLYATTINGGVFVTADEGGSWNPLPELHLYLIGNLA